MDGAHIGDRQGTIDGPAHDVQSPCMQQSSSDSDQRSLLWRNLSLLTIAVGGYIFCKDCRNLVLDF